ncbi:hypothetical protein DKM44_02475 [Deinococcus irradiatisoli]|uniref:Uncharacterized protein n=1 Tax=Deinococcus irradiatisoli TaxID=2202254 RepID=A0A2Z3JFI1_9DEIO|nr:hypothetical protein DKM44_02475 [Deinococcus irradiatisoli]
MAASQFPSRLKVSTVRMPQALAAALHAFYTSPGQAVLAPEHQQALFEFIALAAAGPARADEIEAGVVTMLMDLPQPWPSDWAQELGRQIGFSIGLLRYLARR